MKNIYTFLIGIVLSLFNITAIAQPTVTNYDPANGATDVPVDKTFILTFNEDIKFNDDGIRYYVEIYDGDDNFIKDYQIRGTSVDPELSISGNQLSINPAFDLDGSTVYYIKIDPNAILAVSDNSAFGGITTSTEWRFTTKAPDLYVTNYDPAQDATDIAINKTLVLSFNDNIKFNSSSTRYYVEIYEDGASTPTFEYEIRYGSADSELSISGNQLTIDPASNFDSNKTYYVLIDADGILSDPGDAPFAGITNSSEWKFTTASSAPSVITYDPDQNSTTALIDQQLTLTFDEDIAFNSSSTRYYIEIFKNDGTSVEDWQIRNGSADPGLTISNDKLTIDPTNDLDYLTSYYVIIDADGIVSSSTGMGFPGLTNSSDWAFTTVQEEIPTLNPTDGATDVSRTPTLSATFSDNISFEDNTTITVYQTSDHSNYININTGSGPFYGDRDSRLTINGATFTIDFSDDVLDGNTEWAVYIPTNKLSVNGIYYNGFDDIDNPSWAFTTATDLPKPIVQTYDPAQSATGVSVKKVLTLAFDMNIQANSTTTVTYLKLYKTGNSAPLLECEIDNGTIEPNKGVSITDNVLTIDPSFDFEPDADYYVTIDPGTIESTHGAPFDGIDNSTTSWQFHTEVPPAITAYDPANNTTEVVVDKTINLTFDKNIQPNQSADFYYIKIIDASDDNEFLSISVRNGNFESGKGASISGNVLTIDPPSDFSASKTYYVTIDYGAIEGTDGTTFLGIAENEYTFKTVTNPPAIVSLDPVKDAIEVAPDKILTIDFDKDIQANSGTTNKYLYLYEEGNPTFIYQYTFQGSSISPAGISISGTTMTIDFPSDLNINTNYYLTIDAGAIEAVATGDPFGGIDNSESNNWRFKTVAPPEWTTGYPSIVNQTENNLDLLGQTQKDGNFYYVVTKSATPPTEAQIVSGLDENGDPALITGNGSMSADTEFSSTLDISGLAISIDHYIYIVSQETTYNLYSTIEQLHFIRNVINRWTGSVDNDFNNTNNWSGNSYEIYGSIYIPANSTNYPEISGDIQVNNIEIEAGAQLTISSGSSLTATGDLDLYSSTSVNASLLTLGTLTVNGESRVHQIVTANNRSYYICAPVNGATGYSIGADLGVYYWDNPSNNWVAYNQTSSLEPARGYVVRSNASELLFTGSLNNSDVSIGVLRQNDDDGEGWNLIGNPYPSAVNWDLVPVKDNILDGFWVFLNDQSQYGAYNANSTTAVNITNSVIPSNHAFWVKVLKGFTNGQVTFNNTVRVHNNTTYLKNVTTSSNPTLKIAGVNGSYRDEIAIVFNNNATIDMDEFDSEKKFSNNSNFIQFFTSASGKDLCINGLPLYSNDYTIPLNFNVKSAGTYTIERVDYSNFPNDHTVLLTDSVENKTVDLIADGSYTFSTSVTGIINNRFSLTFKGDFATAIKPNITNNKKTTIYSYDKHIVIKVPELKNAKYHIYSINGQLIKEGLLGSGTSTTVNIEKRGIYIVKVVYKGGVESQKVIIN